MSLRVSLALAVLATALGCRSRETGTSSPPSVSDAGSPTAPPSRPTQPPPPPIAVLGPWQVAEARAAAVSPALWLDGAVRSVVAIPADDARSAEMRWLRWSDGSATVPFGTTGRGSSSAALIQRARLSGVPSRG